MTGGQSNAKQKGTLCVYSTVLYSTVQYSRLGLVQPNVASGGLYSDGSALICSALNA